MNCTVCEKEVPTGTIVLGYGFVCDEEYCKATLEENRHRQEQELLSEPLGQVPDEFGVPEFERFTLKLAVHLLSDEAIRSGLMDINPALTIPYELALHIKEKVLPFVSREYVQEKSYRGHQRLFAGGEYRFVKPASYRVIMDAFKKAGMLQEK